MRISEYNSEYNLCELQNKIYTRKRSKTNQSMKKNEQVEICETVIWKFSGQGLG